MYKNRNSLNLITLAFYLIRWTLLILPVAMVVGAMVAFFLWLLKWATLARWENSWLLLLLPLAGVLIHFLYRLYGKNSEAGNNLIMDEIHRPGGGVPFRMAPLVLFSTVITHLFGGSAGREGTAVQMGGSVSAFLAKKFKLKQEDRRILLLCGMAAGFGAVFGTPVTGAIFALEVLAIGRIKYDALIPCLVASVIADMVCSLFPISHTHYTIGFSAESLPLLYPYIPFQPMLLMQVVCAGVLFGLASFIFSNMTHYIKDLSNRLFDVKWLIPVVGACLVLGISYLLGTMDYLGLGVDSPSEEGVSIMSSFQKGGADHFSWFWKLLLTAITLGMGFKGGEVTPLFFVGATLGNTLAMITGARVDLLSGL